MVDCEIFGVWFQWFHQRFVPSVGKLCQEKGLEEKGFLLLYNAPSYPSFTLLKSDEGKIKAMLLPPNTTSIIQPMDQAVLDPCKRRYKRKSLANIILENDSTDKPVPDILKAVRMKEVVYWIAADWKETTEDSLRKAWPNLFPESANDTEEPVIEDLLDRKNAIAYSAVSLGEEAQNAVAEWLDADANKTGHQILDEDDLVAEMAASDDELDRNDDVYEKDTASDGGAVTPAAALEALETSLG